MKIITSLWTMFLSMPLIAVQLPEWQIIPAQSKLTFTATQNGAPVVGEFKQFGGAIFVDPTNYQASRINIIVDITSVSASYADVTNTLTSADWFNTNLFPKAEFKATEFKQLDSKTYEAIGTLTIRDKTAPVTLKFTAEETSTAHGVIEGSTVIKRTVFGVGQGEWSNTDAVKDDVTVNFKINAVKKN